MKGDKKIRKQLGKLDDALTTVYDVRGVRYEGDDIDRAEFVDRLCEVQSRLDKLFNTCDPPQGIDPGW